MADYQSLGYNQRLINLKSPLIQPSNQDAYNFTSRLVDTGVDVLGPRSVKQDSIAQNVVQGTHITGNSITGTHVVNGGLGSDDIASQNIRGTHLGGSVIAGTHIGLAQIGTQHVAGIVPYTGGTTSVDVGVFTFKVQTLQPNIDQQLNIGGADASSGQSAKEIIFSGGAGGIGDTNGGDIIFIPGEAAGTGTKGFLRFEDASGNQALFDTGTLSVNRTFSFPDSAGTFVLQGQVNTTAGTFNATTRFANGTSLGATGTIPVNQGIGTINLIFHGGVFIGTS